MGPHGSPEVEKKKVKLIISDSDIFLWLCQGDVSIMNKTFELSLVFMK